MKTLIPKSEARKIVLQRRKEFNDDVLLKTNHIIERLAAADDFVYAKRIHIYVSDKPGEVNTKKIIDYAAGNGKQVYLPIFNKETNSFRRLQFTNWDNLKKNLNGYLEPSFGIEEDLSDIDLIIVPAVAISKFGQRVGSGGGYYDKLLRKAYAVKYSVVFEYQVFDSIETDQHDVIIDKIVTERRIINSRETVNNE